MTLHAGISHRHVNAYHQNNSLLFQFILVEFKEAFEEIQLLDVLSNRKPMPILATISYAPTSKETRKQIEASLHKLIGSTREYMRVFSWNSGDGLLCKLKIFCSLFLQNGESEDKELIGMQHYAEKIWQSCHQAIEALYETPDERTNLLVAIEKASNAMHRLSKLIAKSIQQFRDDENVIFYILRHKEEFDKLYGNRFVVKLLSRMYPKGLREVQHFLSQRYALRGFDNILPIIATKINEIEVTTV